MKTSRLLYKITSFVVLIVTMGVVFFVANVNQSGVEFAFLNYKVYTTSGFVLVLFAVLFYVCLRGVYITLRLKHVFEMQKLRYQYKQTLYKTKKQDVSLELSKSLRNFAGKNFISILRKDLRIENLPYYKLYIAKMSSVRKLIVAKKIYQLNENNSTAAIIYAMALYDFTSHTKAKTLLCDFVETRSLNIQNSRSMYIMSQIIIKCEQKLSGNLNFVQKYVDYVNHYDKKHS